MKELNLLLTESNDFNFDNCIFSLESLSIVQCVDVGKILSYRFPNLITLKLDKIQTEVNLDNYPSLNSLEIIGTSIAESKQQYPLVTNLKLGVQNLSQIIKFPFIKNLTIHFSKSSDTSDYSYDNKKYDLIDISEQGSLDRLEINIDPEKIEASFILPKNINFIRLNIDSHLGMDQLHRYLLALFSNLATLVKIQPINFSFSLKKQWLFNLLLTESALNTLESCKDNVIPEPPKKKVQNSNFSMPSFIKDSFHQENGFDRDTKLDSDNTSYEEYRFIYQKSSEKELKSVCSASYRFTVSNYSDNKSAIIYSNEQEDFIEEFKGSNRFTVHSKEILPEEFNGDGYYAKISVEKLFSMYETYVKLTNGWSPLPTLSVYDQLSDIYLPQSSKIRFNLLTQQYEIYIPEHTRKGYNITYIFQTKTMYSFEIPPKLKVVNVNPNLEKIFKHFRK